MWSKSNLLSAILNAFFDDAANCQDYVTRRADEGNSVKRWRNDADSWKPEVPGEKPVSVSRCTPHILQGLAWNFTRTSAMTPANDGRSRGIKSVWMHLPIKEGQLIASPLAPSYFRKGFLFPVTICLFSQSYFVVTGDNVCYSKLCPAPRDSISLKPIHKIPRHWRRSRVYTEFGCHSNK